MKNKVDESEKRKWINAALKAFDTGRWAETMLRALGSRVAKRWKFVSFRGKKGGEWCGIVDVLAIRKNTSKRSKDCLKRGDLFDIILIQIKGGKARLPSPSDIRRLKAVASYYRAKHILLYEWRRQRISQFKVWDRSWKPVKAADIFG